MRCSQDSRESVIRESLVCCVPMCAASPTPPAPKPTQLDPIGAIIYYICATDAKKSGRWLIPSTHKIAQRLRGGANKTDVQVDHLWQDLQWIIDRRLLFDERTHDDPRCHPLEHHAPSQRNVYDRIRHFYPGFNPTDEHAHQYEKHHRQRYMDDREFVEKKVTAIRLIAFKDLYYITDSRVPQKLLFEFLSAEGLVDADEFFGEGGFLSSMNRIRYIDFPGLRRGEEFSDRHKNDPLLVEPGIVFRAQDMYLELRALDHFHELKTSDPFTSAQEDSNFESRRKSRIELSEKAQRFIMEKYPTLVKKST